MTAEKYIQLIIKNIQCTKKRKQDIAKQLMAEIAERTSQGETIDAVIAEMGTVKEVAESFNEGISPEERKKCRRQSSAVIVVTVIVIGILLLTALGLAGYWLLPKVSDIRSSQYFQEQEVEKQVIRMIELLDNDDYAAMREVSTSQMAAVLNEDAMKSAKAQISSNYGDKISIGTIYSQEVTQQGQVMAICQVNVSYSNVAVTYTISFDKDMKLAGLYMK